MKSVKKIVSWFDIFHEPVAFRFKEQPHYESLTGGFCSLILIAIFIGLFFNSGVNTLNKVQIFSTTNSFQYLEPEELQLNTDQNFMFAVGITNLNLNQGNRFFDIFFEDRLYINNNKTGTRVPLEKCSLSHWKNLGQQFKQTYYKAGFDQWLCSPKNYTLKIQGKYTSQIFKHYKVSVAKCDHSLDLNRPCVNQTEIDSFLNANQAFTFKFYYINTLLNPNSNKPISNYFEDINYLTFNTKIGITANLFFTSFEMSTDQSIWPFSQINVVKGSIVTDIAQAFTYQMKFNQYVKFYLRKSSRHLDIQRSFKKADDVLSYIGGLFSTIIAGLFFISKYNETAYQLALAKYFFYEEKDKPYDYAGFNFLKYLGYQIYNIFSTFNIELPWPKIKSYNEALDQVRQQLDIRLIMRKICFLDKFSNLILSKNESNILHLQKPINLDEAISIRKKHKNYYKLKKKLKKFEDNIQKNKNRQIFPISQISQVVDEIGSNGHINHDNRQIDPEIRQFLNSYQELQDKANQHSISQKIINNTDQELKHFYAQWIQIEKDKKEKEKEKEKENSDYSKNSVMKPIDFPDIN